MLRTKNIAAMTLFGVAMLLSVELKAQTLAPSTRYSEAMLQARRIRIAKMATDWRGKRVTLEQADGLRTEGKMLRLHRDRFVLLGEAEKPVEVPVDKVVTITLHAGMSDFFLSGLLGLGSGALTAGIVSLGNEARSNAPVIVGIGGFVVGTLLGIRLLHRDTVIPLDAVPMPERSP